MPQIFINFRGCDAIFDCMLYSRELAPILLDEGDKIVKLLFLADKFDLNLNDLTCGSRESNFDFKKKIGKYKPILDGKQEQHRGIFGKPELNLQQAFHENIMTHNGISQQSPCSSESESPEEKEILTFCVVPSSMCVVLMDAHLASCTACEIHHSRKFRRRFLKYLARNFGFKRCVYDDIDFSQLVYDDFLVIQYMVDVVSVWPKQRLDYKWDRRICELLVKRMLLEEAMAWLSTLGGGYSALGDYDMSHAETAGQVSLKQMKIAMELGDPVIATKCRLFWAQSRMQLGYLGECKKIVRYQYWYAKYANVKDDRLVNMIHGIWSRLQYMYRLRKHYRVAGHITQNRYRVQIDRATLSESTAHQNAFIQTSTPPLITV